MKKFKGMKAAYLPEFESKRIIIDGKETRYRITNTGHLLNDDSGTDQIPSKTPNGYLRVTLSVDGVRYYRSIHRLVAEYFIPNPENKPEVNHIDGDKENNDFRNLEWVTPQENVVHSYDHHLNHSGEKNSLATITDGQAHQICKYLVENKLSPSEIAELTGATKRIVNHIRNGDCWRRISKDYDFSHYNVKERGLYKPEQVQERKLIKEKTIREVCEMIDSGEYSNLHEIAEISGVSFPCVRNISLGRVWKHISKDYNFLKNVA